MYNYGYNITEASKPLAVSSDRDKPDALAWSHLLGSASCIARKYQICKTLTSLEDASTPQDRTLQSIICACLSFDTWLPVAH